MDQTQRFRQQFFNRPLADTDPDIASYIAEEAVRQADQIELIASENLVSQAVLEAQGSVLTNKYAEGYPHKRYYGGCEAVDKVESLAIERVTQLFGCRFANVQPHSGSQANQAVFNALLQPRDTILGMALSAGGHLTHGAAPNQSGKWFHAIQYGVQKEGNLIDYDEVERLACENAPKLIIAGGSAYTRQIDFARFRHIADRVGALLMVDMAHYAGLIATGHYGSPFPYADVATSTTHKTLRGPRGGVILTNDEVIAKKVNSAIFPGIQGGPLMHVIAAKAVAFGEALMPEFKAYNEQVLANARVLASTLAERGLDIVTGGTDCHIVLVDLRPRKVTGNIAEQSLERAGLTCNKNSIPFDPEKPMVTSGLRLGTPVGTTRGFGMEEFREIGNMIGDVLDGLAANPDDNSNAEMMTRERVHELCRAFPIYDFAMSQSEKEAAN
jgi:glycine hydroxymethyltransferase